MTTLGPRLVVAGTHSGSGKTTVTVGLLAAFKAAGVGVASAKVGPDFIDPGYHSLATGRETRNLDPWISGPGSIPALAARAAQGADLLVVEGVMGLFDGASGRLRGAGGGEHPPPHAGPTLPEGSTAHVAHLLHAPVVLVVDASSIGQSVAALAQGFAHHHPRVQVAAVILNNVGSDSHEEMLRNALAETSLEVVGCVRRSPAMSWRDRHLGLVPVAERPDEIRRALAQVAHGVARACDLERISAIGRAAPPLSVTTPRLATKRVGAARIAVAAGPAFSFTYPDNLERLAEAGGDIVPFDPLVDADLPPGTQGLYIGGGFPEVYAETLSANTALLADVAKKAPRIATWAECGGLLWLASALDGHAMAGIVPTQAKMGTSLTLGYRRAKAMSDSPLAAKGQVLFGHEFHYSTATPPGDGWELEGRTGTFLGGFATDLLSASYLHLHLGADPTPAERFVSTAASVDPALIGWGPTRWGKP